MKRSPLMEKATLNQEETAKLYDFSRRKFFRLLKQKNLPFVVMYNKRKLIDREKFETYLRFRPGLKKDLRNGDSPNRKTLQYERSENS